MRLVVLRTPLAFVREDGCEGEGCAQDDESHVRAPSTADALYAAAGAGAPERRRGRLRDAGELSAAAGRPGPLEPRALCRGAHRQVRAGEDTQLPHLPVAAGDAAQAGWYGRPRPDAEVL